MEVGGEESGTHHRVGSLPQYSDCLLWPGPTMKCWPTLQSQVVYIWILNTMIKGHNELWQPKATNNQFMISSKYDNPECSIWMVRVVVYYLLRRHGVPHQQQAAAPPWLLLCLFETTSITNSTTSVYINMIKLCEYAMF